VGVSEDTPKKINGSPEQQEIINYAYEIGNLDFVLMLEAENGTWETTRRSNRVGSNGYSDSGHCQLNRKYHHQFIDSPAFQDYKLQLNYCWEVWKDAERKGRLNTTFYGIANRDRAAKNFTIN